MRCSECLFRWAAADDMTVWSAGAEARTTQQAAAAIAPHRPGQETGSRKKTKAGHPVDLDQRAERDITKASAFLFFLF